MKEKPYDLDKVKAYAREIVKGCQDKGFTIFETSELVHALENEIEDARRPFQHEKFKILT
ncbi:hypothetical protein LJC51_07510 [Lachnospiraceae bacterium OttesenSCG-928-J05]|nr:hypothetical protein [Lachnospiraceae bacterium OttesenSCG-928-J05]